MKSYLTFLSRNKLFAAIQAAGLSVSIAFVILIASYVTQQYKTAHQTPDYQHVFALGSDQYLGLTYWDKEELQMNLPELQAVTHMAFEYAPAVRVGDDLVRLTGMLTDADFFRVFPEYELIEGNINDFETSTDILISQSLARRIAVEGEEVTGKMIEVNETMRTIKGVYRDFDNTFFMPFDMLLHISGGWGATQDRNFGSIGYCTTWYRLRPDADLTEANAKVKSLLHKNYDKNWTPENVEKWHPYRIDEAFFFDGASSSLWRRGNIRMLKLLTAVVLLLLLSAIFNYINLSLALTGKRAKEMATRRLLGETRGSVIMKYICESVLFTAVCFLAALLLAYLLTPMMNTLLSSANSMMASFEMDDLAASFSIHLTPVYWLAYICLICLLGITNGLLPAFAASRYKPIDVIRGTWRRNRKMTVNRIFIVAENVLAVFLISIALVMELQMHHMLRRPTHSQVSNRYYIEYAARDYSQMKLFRDKVEQLPFVTATGVGRGMPGRVNMQIGVPAMNGERIYMPIILCDSTYFRLLGLETEEDFSHPLTHSLWMSRSAYNAAGVCDTSTVFARRMNINGSRPDYIGGIVHDFPTSLASAETLNPYGVVMITTPEELRYSNNLLVETIGEDPSYDEQIRQAYHEYRLEQSGVQEDAMVYGFVSKLNQKQLEPVRRTMRLIELFALLALLIALLGMLAMSTYFADENTKQIAVRKVFGSDVRRETWRNVSSYMRLTLIASCIGILLAVWASRVWLQRFAYRITGYEWVFAVAFVALAAIALLTVLWQTLRAARTNPAEELKKE